MPTPTTIDPALLVRTYLQAQSALMTAITSRLYGPPIEGLPSGITAACAFINLDVDGGPGHPDVPRGRDRFTFHCYGATYTEAMSVYRYLNDALQRARGVNVTVGGKTWRLVFGDRLLGPAPIPEPEILWPRVVAAYEITYSEWAVA